jgi:hypothetical protein
MKPYPDDTLREHEVRLFPSVHIKSEREAELRATASLLAMVSAVPEFGRAVVRRAGGFGGRLSCFTEVPFKLDRSDGAAPEDLRPDGLIQAVYGKKRWSALVEVKVGKAGLDQEQVDKYHRLAWQEGIDAVITVSNQSALPSGRPPVKLRKGKLHKIPVVHFSWERLLSKAQILGRKKAVSDPDQKWMLDEWIRYVDDAKSRIVEPPELGSGWNEVLKAARTKALDTRANELEDVTSHWIGYLQKAALRLSAKLGVEVQPRLTRKEQKEPGIYLERLIKEARANEVLSGALKIPDAAGDLRVDVFLHSRSVRYGLELQAPEEGWQATRVNWLVRQLRGIDDLPTDLQVSIGWSSWGLLTAGPVSRLLADASTFMRDQAGVRIPKDTMPKRFLIQWTTNLQACRSRSNAPVLEGISRGLEDFYRVLMERLVPYVQPAPQLLKPEKSSDETEPSATPHVPETQSTASHPDPAANTALQDDQPSADGGTRDS